MDKINDQANQNQPAKQNQPANQNQPARPARPAKPAKQDGRRNSFSASNFTRNQLTDNKLGNLQSVVNGR